MKQLKSLILLILNFALLLLGACKKEDPKPNSCNISKSLDLGIVALEYDSQNRLIKYKIDDGTTSDFTYNADGKLNIYAPAPVVKNSDYKNFYEFTYTNNLVTAKYYEGFPVNGTYPLRNTYTYELDTQNRLIKSKGLSFEEYRRYEYNPEGNISKVYFYSNGKETLEAEYTNYDNKRNAFFENETLKILNYLYGSHSLMSKNNPTKGTVNNIPFEAKYTYNNLNYPITIQQGNETSTYDYQCSF